MICYPELGKYGRLGNQLFQFASTFAAARKSQDFPAFPKQGHSLGIFKIPNEFFVDNFSCEFLYTDDETDYSFKEQIHLLPRNTAIVGYLQNPKNFLEFKGDLVKILSLKDEISIEANKIMSKYENPVAVHVRRGDYLKLERVLPCQENSYYESGIRLFSSYSPVIFSDDPEWCRNNFSFPVEHHSAEIDFSCMIQCNAHIISNSSFSWWAAFLSSGQVVAPRKWFGPDGPKNWKDFYLEGWKVI